MCDRHVHADCRAGARAAREENIGSFQGLETGWLARQFLGNRLATSEGAVSNTQLLTVGYVACRRRRGVCGAVPVGARVSCAAVSAVSSPTHPARHTASGLAGSWLLDRLCVCMARRIVGKHGHGETRRKHETEQYHDVRLGAGPCFLSSFDQRQIFASQIFMDRGKFLRDF